MEQTRTATWTAPALEEISCAMEINMYAEALAERAEVAEEDAA
ncbi:MAG: hypothetical protein Kilf2KO_12650 [Rhodospirillales bacterium]